MNKKTQHILESLNHHLRPGFADFVRERRVDGAFRLQTHLWGSNLTGERVMQAIEKTLAAVPGVSVGNMETGEGDYTVIFLMAPDPVAERPIKHTPGRWGLNSDRLSISADPIHTDTRNHGYLPIGGSNWQPWMGERGWPVSRQEAEANARLWAASSDLYDYVYERARAGDPAAAALIAKIANEYVAGEPRLVPPSLVDCDHCLQAVEAVRTDPQNGARFCSQCLVNFGRYDLIQNEL